MNSFWQDLKFGIRQLRLSPGFALVGILSLGLGIGANTAIFQLIDALRLRAMPVSKPEQLATVHIKDRNWGVRKFLQLVRGADVSDVAAGRAAADVTCANRGVGPGHVQPREGRRDALRARTFCDRRFFPGAGYAAA